MKQPKFKTNYNQHLFSSDREKNSEPSMTVPDESYTIKELLEKFAIGTMPEIGKNAVYDDVDYDEIDVTRLQNVDLVDAMQEVERLENIIAEKQKIEAAEKQKLLDAKRAQDREQWAKRNGYVKQSNRKSEEKIIEQTEKKADGVIPPQED